MTISTNRLLSLLAAFAATTTLIIASSAPSPAHMQTASLAVPGIAA